MILFFLQSSSELGPSACMPAADQVFSPGAAHLAGLLALVLTVDGSNLHPEWKLNLHFLYGTYHREGGLSFKLNSTGKIGEVLGDIPDAAFDSKVSEPLRPDFSSMELVAARSNDMKDSSRNEMDCEKLYDLYKKVCPEALWMSWLGPDSLPYWYQHPEWPICPETRSSMHFVGQISVEVFSRDLPDCGIYLFYSPESSVQTLIYQST